MSRKLSKCKNVRRAGDLKSMSSKTILLGLGIFRCGSERSVHGRPSWELAPYDRESERTKDFTVWCRDASTECCFNKNKGMLNNCEAKGLGCVLTLPIYRGREQHGNGREAGDKGTGSGRVRYGRREVLTPCPPPHSWSEGVRTFAFSTSMSCGGLKKNRTKNKAKKGKTGKDKHLELSTASN